ncbi:hypothetical protein K431DRAFT_300855 [Polychaeton citri CBS 116435]|uniref:Xylanolytic transcriptional activator regulatory domain-containing protein n=1 Tax=Polychaeton citri CBS 116435 TaxID=1314669 RepID=A0A9P4QGN1_9PEZI|nr:hypothetical protein K431DRAFT_300855 [Polychaeton citri CBS 116435]
MGRLRAGEKAESILKHPEHIVYYDHTPGTRESHQRQMFLTSLSQSTGSTRDILDIASTLLRTRTQTTLPTREALLPFKDCVINIETLCNIVADRELSRRLVGLEGPILPRHAPSLDGSYNGPPFWVPASPWTGIANSDFTVSHLVSLFLAYVNPFWRFVEVDLFIAAMRTRNPDSGYCTPLLVNAILALAAQYSEIDDAFSKREEYVNRGDHFHEEALRLWDLEHGRVSIASVQALTVLVLDAYLRGRDRLSRSLLTTAFTLMRDIPESNALLNSPRTRNEYTRCWKCTAWSVANWYIAFFNAQQLRVIERRGMPRDLPDPDDIFPDTLVHWIGYPLHRWPTPLRPNALARHRCRLSQFMEDLAHLPDGGEDAFEEDSFWKLFKSLFSKLEGWHAQWPEGLRCTEDTVPCLFELHGQYHCTMFELCTKAFEVLFGRKKPRSPTQNITHPSGQLDSRYRRIRKYTLEHVFQVAKELENFRIKYGYKITVPYVIQEAALAAFALLRYMDDDNNNTSRENPKDKQAETDNQTEKLEASLEECFRCLLASGTQLMLPRGIARMLYHTSGVLEIQLPTRIREMIALIAEAAWQPSDLRRLSSAYPNLTLSVKGDTKLYKMHMDEMLRNFEAARVDDDKTINFSPESST